MWALSTMKRWVNGCDYEKVSTRNANTFVGYIENFSRISALSPCTTENDAESTELNVPACFLTVDTWGDTTRVTKAFINELSEKSKIARLLCSDKEIGVVLFFFWWLSSIATSLPSERHMLMLKSMTEIMEWVKKIIRNTNKIRDLLKINKNEATSWPCTATRLTDIYSHTVVVTVRGVKIIADQRHSDRHRRFTLSTQYRNFETE